MLRAINKEQSEEEQRTDVQDPNSESQQQQYKSDKNPRELKINQDSFEDEYYEQDGGVSWLNDDKDEFGFGDDDFEGEKSD